MIVSEKIVHKMYFMSNVLPTQGTHSNICKFINKLTNDKCCIIPGFSWASVGLITPHSPLLNFIGCKWKQKHLKICSFHDNYYGACTKNNVCLVLEKKSIAGNVEVSLITIANIKVHLLRYSPLHQKINVWAVTTIIKPGSMAADLLLFI